MLAFFLEQALQLHKENTLLDVLSHCLATNFLTFQLVCQLMMVSGAPRVLTYLYCKVKVLTAALDILCVQNGSGSKEELADKVVLKQFLDRIVLSRVDVTGELEPEDKQRALVGRSTCTILNHVCITLIHFLSL